MLDVFRQPVDLLVVGEHLILELRRANEPTLTRVLNQRIFIGTPAERIVVDVLLLVIELAFLFEAASNFFVTFFYPAAFVVGRFSGEFTIRTDRTDQLRPLAIDEAGLLLQEQIKVDFAERRGFVYSPSSAIDRHKVGCCYPPSNMLFVA